jgi:phosphatidate cytidylyltransferase
MKELAIRGLSGLLYVALIVSSALISDLALVIVLFIFSGLALFEFQRLLQYKSPIPFLLFGLLVYQLYIKEPSSNMLYSFLALSVLANLVLTYLLFSNKPFPSAPYQKSSLSFFYLVGSAYFIVATTHIETNLNNSITLIMYLLIWVNNSFAYLSGKKWGNKPLFPSISPKKTWEGLWGGAIACIVTGLVISFFDDSLPVWSFTFLALIIILTATIGDLIQSKFKRQAKVKDSGSLIPGHGGFYDRMDSVLFTAPFVYLFIIIVNYVS